jgi:hypothetical protein
VEAFQSIRQQSTVASPFIQYITLPDENETVLGKLMVDDVDGD